MKNRLLFASLMILPFLSNAQLGARRIFNFDVISNDPRIDPAFTFNLEVASLHLAPTNPSGSAINFGFWGIAQPNENWGFDYLLRTSYGVLFDASSDTPLHLQGEFGGHFLALKRTRTIPTRLVTHRSSSRATNIEFQNKSVARRVPTTIYSILGLRGGYLHRQGGLTFKKSSTLNTRFDYDKAQYNANGVYLGLLLRYTMNTYISSVYGQQTNAKVIEVYGDFMSFPAVTFESLTEGADFGESITSNVEEFGSASSTNGWRIGVRTYQSKRNLRGTNNRARQRFRSAVFVGVSAELGAIPYSGFYLGTGLSFTLVKKSRAVDLPLR